MKENFRPEIFEKCMFAQMSTFFDKILSTMQFSKRIQYSTLPFGNVGNMEEVCR